MAGTAGFLLLAPGAIVGLLPWWLTRWHMNAPLGGWDPVRAVGFALLAGGSVLVIETFGRFALQGIGTPAPILPTVHLVVRGSYRVVRNPMYVGVVSMVLGQGLVFGDLRVLALGASGWLAAHLFVLAYEEPTLRRTFGTEYEDYCRRVPRWIPRAPSEVHVKSRIRASPEAVFAVIGDHEAFLRGALLTTRLIREGSPERNGTGAQREVLAKPGFRFVEEITRWDPPRGYDYLIREGTIPLRHLGGQLVLTPDGDRTSVDWTTAFRVAVPLVGGILTAVLWLILTITFQGLLRGARHRIESQR